MLNPSKAYTKAISINQTMNIFQSIYFRAKQFVKKTDRKEILQRNALDERTIEGVPDSMIEGLETVRNYIDRANVLLDIGTHRGLFSKAANAFFEFDQTLCFEPNVVQNEWITRNCQGFKHNIQNVALADREGEMKFFLHEDETMNSLMASDESVLKSEFPYDDPAKMKETTVPVSTLDKAISELEIPEATFFLKIDTQGNELNVLKHGTEVLARTEICFIEYMFLSPYENNFSFHELVAFMDAQGFDCQGALSILKRPSKKVSAVDFLFVKRKA